MTDDPYSIPPFVGPTGGLSQSTRTPQPRPGSTPTEMPCELPHRGKAPGRAIGTFQVFDGDQPTMTRPARMCEACIAFAKSCGMAVTEVPDA